MNETPQDKTSHEETPEAPTPRDQGGPWAQATVAMAGRRALLVAAAVLTILAVALLTVGITQQEPAPPRADTVPAASSEAGEASAPAGRDKAESKDHEGHGTSASPAREAVLSGSAPERITVPSLGVDSPLVDLGLDADRVMDTPDDPDKAGWFTLGPTPGERGPSVIAGHVTWNGKPAVFFELGKAKKGTRIEVGRTDGKTAVFTVDRTVRYSKDKFPTVEVYRNLDHAGLRLITCGGEYDDATHRYADNVVVYASLTTVR
ncbi:class F sortase [Streptomyces sp. H27-C3]|uniref:class F sortase n=1 Tax=Streptomyces sp. H27-C3 TaxID=3046305 RepID=UPI0024BAEFD7|nr:class F sortase [Streptomyces sp. H27-C3]MDJ0466654.1 class F sortase [Streptomyces sp. H27-C3]